MIDSDDSDDSDNIMRREARERWKLYGRKHKDKHSVVHDQRIDIIYLKEVH